MANKVYISWEQIDILIDNLATKIKDDYRSFLDIHGIERGGLIPAVMLSHKLGIPYSNKINSNTLVIDDICDTGHTLDNIVGIHTAVLHYKPHTSKFKPTFYSEEFNSDSWLVYPWENIDSKPIQGYLEK